MLSSNSDEGFKTYIPSLSYSPPPPPPPHTHKDTSSYPQKCPEDAHCPNGTAEPIFCHNLFTYSKRKKVWLLYSCTTCSFTYLGLTFYTRTKFTEKISQPAPKKRSAMAWNRTWNFPSIHDSGLYKHKDL